MSLKLIRIRHAVLAAEIRSPWIAPREFSVDGRLQASRRVVWSGGLPLLRTSEKIDRLATIGSNMYADPRSFAATKRTGSAGSDITERDGFENATPSDSLDVVVSISHGPALVQFRAAGAGDGYP